MVLALIVSLISVAATVGAIWIVLVRIGPRDKPTVDPALLTTDGSGRASTHPSLEVDQLRRLSPTELIREVLLLRVELADAKRDAVEARHDAAEALRVAGQRPSPRNRDLRERQWRARRELPDEAHSELHSVA